MTALDVEPGQLIHTGPMTQVDYRADLTWLRHSTAKKLLPPSCPAIAHHELHNPPEPTDALGFGKAAHSLVLGAGDELAIVDADDWRTKVAQQARKDARAAGKVPVLTAQAEQIYAMADQIRRHRLAARLLDPERGQPEHAIVWRDESLPVTRATLIDWLPDVAGGRLILPEYKTAAEAYPHEWSRKTAGYGYHSQAAWNLDALEALHPGADVAVVHVVQSKVAPYPVVVVEYQQADLDQGREENRRAIQVWHQCMTREVWPGFDDPDRPQVVPVSLPPWALTLVRA